MATLLGRYSRELLSELLSESASERRYGSPKLPRSTATLPVASSGANEVAASAVASSETPYSAVPEPV